MDIDVYLVNLNMFLLFHLTTVFLNGLLLLFLGFT